MPLHALGAADRSARPSPSPLLALVPLVLLAFALRPTGKPLWLTLPIAAILSYGLYEHPDQEAPAPPQDPQPTLSAEWEAVLQREVVFFRALEPAEQLRFRRELQVFLGEKRITGIKTELDETTRVLAAASAIIPIFGFPEWEWDQISEVLIYPSRFDEDFAFDDGDGHHTLGMVGTGAMNRMMILSKPDLLARLPQPGRQAQRRPARVRPPGGQVRRHDRRPAGASGSTARRSVRGSSWCGARWRRSDAATPTSTPTR